jgi:hypothetical protein
MVGNFTFLQLSSGVLASYVIRALDMSTAPNSFVDLSGVTAITENPYDALIDACNNDPVSADELRFDGAMNWGLFAVHWLLVLRMDDIPALTMRVWAKSSVLQIVGSDSIPV